MTILEYRCVRVYELEKLEAIKKLFDDKISYTKIINDSVKEYHKKLTNSN